MRLAIAFIAALLYAPPLFAQCLELPIVGNGIDPKGKAESAWTDTEGSFRPKIPDELVQAYPKMANTYTTIGFPKVVKGILTASTVITCFSASLTIPEKLAPMTRDDANRLAKDRDATITFNPDALKLPTPKTAIQKAIDSSIRTLWRYIGPALAWATSSTDNFNRGTGSDLGAAWDPYNDGASTPCALDGDKVSGTSDLARCVEGYSTYIPGSNQYVQFVLKADTGGGFGGAMDASAYVRLAAPTTLTGYACRLLPPDQTNRSRVRRYDGGGSNSSLANDTTTTWANNDVARCEVNGSVVTVKQNGTTVLTASGDTTYTSGRGGIGVLSTPGAGNQVWIDDFEVGDLVGGATVVRHRPIVIQ